MSDSSIFYANLKLPKYPFKKENKILWPVAKEGFNKIELIDRSNISEDISDIFSSIGLNIDKVFLWTWDKPSNDFVYDIHTDGHLSSPNIRKCAINWTIEGDSCVDWFSFSGLEPKFSYKEKSSYSVTEYTFRDLPENLARWTGKYPALLNIFQPHQVKVKTIRKSVSIRFLPNISIEEFIQRLNHLIISINEE